MVAELVVVPRRKEEDLVVHRARVSEYCLSVPTIPMMSDYEEDLVDFPVENIDRLAESLVGAYRAESTDQRTAGSGITTKIPPRFEGSTSWFKHEELVDDSLDLIVLEAENRGPVLKNRFVGCRNAQRTS